MPVTCPYCGREFKGDKLNARHLSKCNPSLRKPVPPCLCGHESTSMTQMKRHRRTCEVWKNRDRGKVAESRRKQTLLEKYGTDNLRNVEEFNEKIRQTNLERYGAENPLARESSLYEKVQKSLEGKRGHAPGSPNNPFCNPEVQKAIRQTWQEKYGADNPQRVPEIRQKTRETNLQRYGYEELLSSPEIRSKIRQTCEAKYGGPAPSCSPDVKEKARQTNLKRWGVEWTSQHNEVRKKQRETMWANYGTHFFSSEEGRKVLEGIFQEKYGKDGPLLVPEIHAKTLATFRKNHPELEWPCMQAWRNSGPNGFETRIASLFPDDGPDIEFTGNRTFWVDLPSLGKKKNPDFVVRPHRKHRKVIECFGDYFHSEKFTGKPPKEHEEETIAAYAEKGIACLVIWESEMSSPGDVERRIAEFLSEG